MPFNPTPKQQQFLLYLEKEIARTGKTPSLHEAAAQMGGSHAAIYRHSNIFALNVKGDSMSGVHQRPEMVEKL